MVGQIVDVVFFARGRQYNDVPVGDPPAGPDVLGRRVLKPRQAPAESERVVELLGTDQVNAQKLNRKRGCLLVQLLLQLVEVAELATTVASPGVPEVPGAHHSLKIVRRHGLEVGR